MSNLATLIRQVREATGTIDMEYQPYRRSVREICNEAERMMLESIPLKPRESNQDSIAGWMRAAGQDAPASPTIPSDKIQRLRVSLVLDEALELDLAFRNNDLVEVADAIADLLYVIYGTAVACGIDAQKCLDEVHRSNMTKLDGMVVREDGKILKGPHYDPPNLKRIIENAQTKAT